MSEAAIQIERMRKTYRGGIRALSEVAFEVPRGSVFGLLGPNGAGKSTLVKSLLTIIRPSECSGTLLGHPIGHRAALARVGYLPEHADFPRYLTGRQVVMFSAGLAGVPRGVARGRAEELLERTGMKEAAGRLVGTYSKGMKQRIGIAQALVNEPELVLLDEPTDGVDPGGRVEIREMVRALRDEGRTVFVNSHLLGEMEQMADQVAILANGKVIESGRLDELTSRELRYEIRTRGPVPFEMKERLEGGEIRGDRVILEVRNPAGIQATIDRMRAAGLVIREIREHRSSLEDVFLEAVRKGGPS